MEYTPLAFITNKCKFKENINCIKDYTSYCKIQERIYSINA